MMFKTFRSRLWLGYSLLILIIAGSFFIGLGITLTRTSVLFRQVVLQMRLAEQSVLDRVIASGDPSLDQIKKVLLENPVADSMRVVVLDARGQTLFDSKADNAKPINWLTLVGVKRSEEQNSSSFIRDSNRRIWIYTGKRIPKTDMYLVIASLRGNLTIKFMLSDPMVRMIVNVIVWSVFISFLLTLLMDRWLVRPLRKISKNAHSLGIKEGAQIPVEGSMEVQELATALNLMSQRVHESQQSQRDFISDVSHELKTPLTSIQGYSNAILDGTVSGEESIKNAASVISTESKRMLGLVLDLLTLTRLEGRVGRLEPQNIDLEALVKQVFEKLSISSIGNKVELKSNLQNLPVLRADFDGITQIMINLVENAIKFTPQGGTVVVSGGQVGGTVEIHITDNGFGISETELPKIFNRFYQVDKSRKVGSSKSAGLGLTIAKEIARAHGGDIVVKSRVNEGTTFTLILPLIPPEMVK
jgi:signal transduction histidine kinase